jgi:hypothetical protein
MEPNPSFSKSIPQLQIAWDSTSLGLLKTCPRKYYYKMIENWSTKSQSLHLDFGIFYHSALEEYDKARAENIDHENGVLLAVRKALEISKDFVGDNYKNRQTLVRAIVWYLEHFKDDTAETIILANGKPAVELSFRMELPLASPEGETYLACGHLDKAVKWQNGVYILDRKTTKGTLGSFYFDQYSPNNQMSMYSMAGKIVLERDAAGIIIDAVQIAVGFCRYARGIVNRTKGQLDEWLDDTLFWIKMAEKFAANGSWPMNDTACSMYGGCEFREVCSKDSSVRKNFLEADFVKRVWNPLQVRGD